MRNWSAVVTNNPQILVAQEVSLMPPVCHLAGEPWNLVSGGFPIQIIAGFNDRGERTR